MFLGIYSELKYFQKDSIFSTYMIVQNLEIYLILSSIIFDVKSLMTLNMIKNKLYVWMLYDTYPNYN